MLQPHSGRHHQARAHRSYGLRAPVVGDPVYYDLSYQPAGAESGASLGPRYHLEESKRERVELLGAQPFCASQLPVFTFDPTRRSPIRGA